MSIIKAIQERRSVRQFKDKKVDRKILEEIISAARWSPSWANLQVARYTVVDDPELITRIAEEGVQGFAYNMNTLRNAKGVVVLSYVRGKSGKISDLEYATKRGSVWEVFDAGIACQTFCLAAHAHGIGTCIFGVIDEENLATLVNLPEDEDVAALIVYGYGEGTPAASSRKPVDEIARFIG